MRETLNFRATQDIVELYTGAQYVIVATPTDYDPKSNYFNTKSVESVIHDVQKINPAPLLLNPPSLALLSACVKSLIHQCDFLPEFLREGRALGITCTHHVLCG